VSQSGGILGSLLSRAADILIRSARLDRNTSTAPENGFSSST
jgi:hypothetical protein